MLVLNQYGSRMFSGLTLWFAIEKTTNANIAVQCMQIRVIYGDFITNCTHINQGIIKSLQYGKDAIPHTFIHATKRPATFWQYMPSIKSCFRKIALWSENTRRRKLTMHKKHKCPDDVRNDFTLTLQSVTMGSDFQSAESAIKVSYIGRKEENGVACLRLYWLRSLLDISLRSANVCNQKTCPANVLYSSWDLASVELQAISSTYHHFTSRT